MWMEMAIPIRLTVMIQTHFDTQKPMKSVTVDNTGDGNVDEGYPLLDLFVDADGDAYGAEPTEPSCVALPQGHLFGVRL